MKLVLLPILLVSTVTPSAVHGQGTRSPYTTFESRSIKALSAEDVSALLAGDGMGFALPAELNGYPGPKHVLELSDSLGLAPEQIAQVRAVFDVMSERAKELGSDIVRLERELDDAFSQRTISTDSLVALTTLIASRNGELRATHLRAHLDLEHVLSTDQKMNYQRLRGYGHGGHVHRGSGLD